MFVARFFGCRKQIATDASFCGTIEKPERRKLCSIVFRNRQDDPDALGKTDMKTDRF
jgi:hypothetical protein